MTLHIIPRTIKHLTTFHSWFSLCFLDNSILEDSAYHLHIFCAINRDFITIFIKDWSNVLVWEEVKFFNSVVFKFLSDNFYIFFTCCLEPIRVLSLPMSGVLNPYSSPFKLIGIRVKHINFIHLLTL